MEFVITTENMVGFGLGLGIMIVLGFLMRRRKSTPSEGFLSKVFQSNKDLDTTIGLLLGAFLVWTCIMHFQDGIQGSEAGYIVLGGLNGFFALAGYKKGLEHGQANGNGGHPK